MEEYQKTIQEKELKIAELTLENNELRRANEAFEKLFTEIEAGFEKLLKNTAE